MSHPVTAEPGLMHGTATARQILWATALTAVFAPLTMLLDRNNR